MKTVAQNIEKKHKTANIGRETAKLKILKHFMGRTPLPRAKKNPWNRRKSLHAASFGRETAKNSKILKSTHFQENVCFLNLKGWDNTEYVLCTGEMDRLRSLLTEVVVSDQYYGAQVLGVHPER